MNRIKEILLEQGRPQTSLAEKIGKSYVAVTNYCNNKSQPSLPTLMKIANILNIDIRELLESTKGKTDY